MPVTGPTIDAALERAGQFLAASTAQVGLLGRVVPRNAGEERERLLGAWRAGTRALPNFSYHPGDLESLRVELTRFSEHPGLGDLPLGQALSERAREIALEAEMVVYRGTKTFGALAAQRFSTFSAALRGRGHALARAWLQGGPHRETEAIPVDDELHPASLVSRLRADVAARGLPFRVTVTTGLSALAATGNDAIFVAAGRVADRETTERTVIHEIEGHVLPRVRSAAATHPLLRVGSARGTCDQEGYALSIEEKNGFLNARRKRELALRHCIAERMRDGGDFADSVGLARDHGEPLDVALRLAERAHRGGNGSGAGLGREVVYLTSYLRVKDHLAQNAAAERTLGSGQVSCEWLEAATPWLNGSTS